MGTTFFVFDTLKIRSTMRKDTKARAKGQLPLYRHSIVFHPLRKGLGLTIFEFCLLDTLLRNSRRNEFSKGVSFLSNHILVSRNRVYDALHSFSVRGWLNGNPDEKTFHFNPELAQRWEDARNQSGESLRYTKVFHALRGELGVDFKAYCLLDAVYHLSKSKGSSIAHPNYFEKVLDIPERDFYRKRVVLAPYLTRSGISGLKLNPETQAKFSQYLALSGEKCSKTAE